MRSCLQLSCDRMEPCKAQRSGWCAHPDAHDGTEPCCPDCGAPEGTDHLDDCEAAG